MKYSLANLLLLTALIAVLAGWFYDHRRLTADRERLNAESAELASKLVFEHAFGSSTVTIGTRPAPPRSYDFENEDDRREFLRDYIDKPFDIPMANFNGSAQGGIIMGPTASAQNGSHGEITLSPPITGWKSSNSTR